MRLDAQIASGEVILAAGIDMPLNPRGVAIIPTNSSIDAARVDHVQAVLQEADFVTVVVQEPLVGSLSQHDILASEWVGDVAEWVHDTHSLSDLPVSFVGVDAASPGVLRAAESDHRIASVVTLGTHPGTHHSLVPTLHLVDDEDSTWWDVGTTCLVPSGGQTTSLQHAGTAVRSWLETHGTVSITEY